MAAAQQGVQGFVGAAITQNVPFAFGTVFSHWRLLPDGSHESKIGIVLDLQAARHFVLLIVVGLTSADLSIGRVMTRVSKGGHHVPENKLRERFRRTQQAVSQAISVADAAILLDNSCSEKLAFTRAFICRRERVEYDICESMPRPPGEITAWLDMIVPP